MINCSLLLEMTLVQGFFKPCQIASYLIPSCIAFCVHFFFLQLILFLLTGTAGFRSTMQSCTKDQCENFCLIINSVLSRCFPTGHPNYSTLVFDLRIQHPYQAFCMTTIELMQFRYRVTGKKGFLCTLSFK